MEEAPWWLTDTYDRDVPVPVILEGLCGPEGLALVKLWKSGTTSPGWGLAGKDGGDGFMPRYMRGEFNHRRILYGYSLDKWAFSFVMRSMNVVVIDIDGKNSGIEHAEDFLQGAPPTLAEVSKSGNGFHLFYRTTEAWDPTTGYGHAIGDHIGIVTGVDVRAVGCVHHHNTQRWNSRLLADLPKDIENKLRAKQAAREAQRSAVSVTEGMDTTEVIMIHDALITELNKPLKPGGRNNALFAIGQKMKDAGVPDWQNLIEVRANQVGLPSDEAAKLVSNIEAYGS